MGDTEHLAGSKGREELVRVNIRSLTIPNLSVVAEAREAALTEIRDAAQAETQTILDLATSASRAKFASTMKIHRQGWRERRRPQARGSDEPAAAERMGVG